jgi:hypothetical protein
MALVLGAALLAMPTFAAACETGEDTGPLITEASLTPANLPSEGGTGIISARAADDCGVQRVIAEINTGEGNFVSFELLPAEDINTNARVYRGEFEVPRNSFESPVDYLGTISAESTGGLLAEAFAGEIEVAGAPPFDEKPFLFDPSVTPSVWGGLGGTSTIAVSATDNRGIASAYAIVTLPSGREETIPLEPISSSIFVGRLTVPGNPGDSPRGYGVAAFAEDDIGQTTSINAGSVTVEPKGTPNPGFLTLEPGYLRFGPVTLGGNAMRTVVLKNAGKSGSPPVSGILRSSEPQFVLPGTTEAGVPFTLAPGEERTFQVDFQPSLTGQQTGRLTVVREDGRQPNTGLSLFGWGVR